VARAPFERCSLTQLCWHVCICRHSQPTDERRSRGRDRVLDWAVREIASPEGGFYSTQDADSEGEEGRFYIWDPGEIAASSMRDQAASLRTVAYGITPERTTSKERTSSIWSDRWKDRPRSWERMSRASSLSWPRRMHASTPHDRCASAPGRDEKVLAAWNGMMLKAFAEGGRGLASDVYTSRSPSTTPNS